MVCYNRPIVAKEIAQILAENEATIDDVTEIFKEIKKYLIVKYDSGERESSGNGLQT